MINYKLAKQLKEAGFPQEGKGELRAKPIGEELVYYPTLSELIDFVDGNDRMKEIEKEYAEKALHKLRKNKVNK